MNSEMMLHRLPRRRNPSRVRRLGWTVFLGALLLVPFELAAQKESSKPSSKPSVSGSSGSRSSGGSRARSAPPRSSSSRSGSSVSRSKGSSSKGSPSVRSGSRSSAKGRSASKHKSSPSKPRISSPSRPKGGSTSSYSDSAAGTRKSKPSVRSSSKNSPPVTSVPNRRLLIESVDAKNRYRDSSGKAPGTVGGGSHSGGHSGGHHGGRHYYPYSYHHYYHYYPYHYYPYYFYGPYGYHYYPYPRQSYRGDGLGALDLNVKPKKAVVYIDGNPIGPVGRYDGYPAYLWLEPGSYELTFYLEGYQTLTRRYTVRAEVVTAIHELLPPGEATPPPEPAPLPPPPEDFSLREDGDDHGVGGEAEIGRIRLSIRPGDTAIYLDGHFLGTAEELAQLSAGLIVEPGQHTLELVRPGYVTEEVPISVPGGESVDVDLELRRR